MRFAAPISVLYATGPGFDYELDATIVSYDPPDLPIGDPVYCVWNAGTGQYDCQGLTSLVDAASADITPTIADRYTGDTTFCSYVPAGPPWGIGNRCQGVRGYDALTDADDTYDGTPKAYDVTACVTGPGAPNPRWNWGVLPNYAGGCYDVTLGPNKIGPFRLRWYRSTAGGVANADGSWISIILDTDAGTGIGSWWAIEPFYRATGSLPKFWSEIPNDDPIILQWTPGEAFSTVDAPEGVNLDTLPRQPMPSIELRSCGAVADCSAVSCLPQCVHQDCGGGQYRSRHVYLHVTGCACLATAAPTEMPTVDGGGIQSGAFGDGVSCPIAQIDYTCGEAGLLRTVTITPLGEETSGGFVPGTPVIYGPTVVSAGCSGGDWADSVTVDVPGCGSTTFDVFTDPVDTEWVYL